MKDVVNNGDQHTGRMEKIQIVVDLNYNILEDICLGTFMLSTHKNKPSKNSC